MRLIGKVALITGAGTGIGRATAMLFATQGAKVMVVELDKQSGAATVEAIRRAGGEAAFTVTDVTEPEQMSSAVADAVRIFGRLDILYNNVGGSTPRDGPVTTAPFEEFWHKMKVDVFGTWLGCHYAIPAMIESGGGSVINATSMCGLMGTPGRDAYTAAKGAVAALTRSMAVEFAPYKIRVNAVAPAVTLTERVVNIIGDGGEAARIYKGHLLGPVMPDDVAHAILYLASDEARVTTGQILAVDSGVTIS